MPLDNPILLLVTRNKKSKVKLRERHLIVRSGRKHMLGLVQQIQTSLWLIARFVQSLFGLIIKDCHKSSYMRNVTNLVRLFLIREHLKLDRKVKLVYQRVRLF